MAALMVPSFRISVYVGAAGSFGGAGAMPGPGHQAAKYPSWIVAVTGPCSMVLMTTEATSEPTRPMLE
jgi:hypothetical protein